MTANAYPHDDHEFGIHKVEKIEQYLAGDLPKGLTSSTSVTLTAVTDVTLVAGTVVGVGGHQSAGSVGGFFLEEVATAPTGSLTSGGLLYVKSGSLCFFGSAGHTTVLAAS